MAPNSSCRRYIARFIKAIRENQDLDLYLDEQAEEMYIDRKLGLRLCHGEVSCLNASTGSLSTPRLPMASTNALARSTQLMSFTTAIDSTS